MAVARSKFCHRLGLDASTTGADGIKAEIFPSSVVSISMLAMYSFGTASFEFDKVVFLICWEQLNSYVRECPLICTGPGFH